MNTNMNEMSNVEMEIVECPICMDQIEDNKNKVITECGHCFHTSCLMKNVAHNGFGCPYCRDAMAEPFKDNNSDEDYDEFSIDEEDEEPDYTDNVLRGARWLFQRVEGDEIDDDIDTDSDSDDDEDEERDEVEPRPPVDYIVEKLIQRGVSMADLVKSILIRDHEEYQFHDEFDREDNILFGKFRIVISNYQPTAPVVVVPVNVEQPPQAQSQEVKVEDDDFDYPNFEKFNQHCNTYYSLERRARYEKMNALAQEPVNMPFSFQMKGTCRNI